MTDILDLIDQVTTDEPARCWQCAGVLGASVSDDFCSQDCQTAWHANRSEPLVGYREPVDLPQHYSHEPALSPVNERARWISNMSARIDAELLAHTNIPPALAAPERTNGPVTFSPAEFRQHTYRRAHCDGHRWFYVTEQRHGLDHTIPATDEHPELAVRHLHPDFPRDSWFVEISGGDWIGRGWLPGELLADNDAVRAWFGDHRSAALARAEAEAYAESEQREPSAWLPTFPMFRATWHAEPVVARERVIPVGEPYRPLLPSPITPRRADRRLYEGNWTPPDRPVLIFARGYPYARNIARACNLNPQQWRYVDGIPRLSGLEGGRYYMDPSFWEHPDADELLAMLRTRRMTEMTITELGALNRE